MLDGSDSVEAFAAGLAELTAVVLSTPTVEQALHDTVAITAKILPGKPMVAVTLHIDEDPVTIASSGPHAQVIDELQHSHGLGPCLQAIESGRTVTSPDLIEEHRWGGYPSRMLAEGIRCVLSEPLLVRDATVGSLNVYSVQPQAFSERDKQSIVVTAAHAAVLLDAVTRMRRQAELTEQLQAALASRTVIDQALGIVMAQRKCGVDAAFEALRQASQRRNVKVAAVAADLIRVTTGAEPGTTHFNRPGQRRRKDGDR
ncbi:GAF and ANTAR domain-containing protein [Nocardia sp. NPDC050406]|uniref:GAF and ANTAR domain-containing protein n=1 Tax=Nocardia sp. NPDC050406 TaxID=3364318 RepID=UPI00378FDB25